MRPLTFRERNHYKWWMLLLEECELCLGRRIMILGAQILDRQFHGDKPSDYMGCTEHIRGKRSLRWRIEVEG